MSLPIAPKPNMTPSAAQPQRAQVWTCGSCNNQLFFLHVDGSVECGGCGKFSEGQRCGTLQ